jgi:hypothetical protein
MPQAVRQHEPPAFDLRDVGGDQSLSGLRELGEHSHWFHPKDEHATNEAGDYPAGRSIAPTASAVVEVLEMKDWSVSPDHVSRMVEALTGIHGTLVLPYIARSQPMPIIIPDDCVHRFSIGDRIRLGNETATITRLALELPRSVPGRLEWLALQVPNRHRADQITFMNRLTENDTNFGPFTFGRWRKSIYLYIEGPNNDEPASKLMAVAFGWALRMKLPRLLKPFGKYGEHSRRYGFGLSNMGNGYDFFHLFYGPQTHDSSTTKSWSTHFPWTQWTHIRHTIYMPDGTAFYSEGLKSDWRTFSPMKDQCPKTYFGFEDYDGEMIVATCVIEEREWHKGRGVFRWLRWFSQPLIRRSLDLEFSAEVGPRKGSWKGGAIGHGIDMLAGETPEQAFRRYCEAGYERRGKKTGLRFIGPCEAPPPKVYAADPGDQPAAQQIT